MKKDKKKYSAEEMLECKKALLKNLRAVIDTIERENMTDAKKQVPNLQMVAEYLERNINNLIKEK